jgi:GNAT superfamily N-acetyltransferase
MPSTKKDLRMTAAVKIEWCVDPLTADVLARFIATNITTSYISHSELQGPRAVGPESWSPNLVDLIREEIHERVTQGRGRVDAKEPSYLVLTAHEDGRLACVSLVGFFPAANIPHAIIEDLVVDEKRRERGIGKSVLDWVALEAKAIKIKSLFLESGKDNERAHHFFEREGFDICSVVMMRVL